MEVVEALAQAKFASAGEIAGVTSLPRPTVYRILETLMAEGYVERLDDSDFFYLTGALRKLAQGLGVEAEATGIAARILRILSVHIAWPVDFSTYDKGTMVIRHSTHGSSPRSLIARATAGFRVAMTTTSPGLAYLAWLPREEVVLVLAQCPGGERADSALWRKLKLIRERGYASRQGGSSRTTSSSALPRTSSIAVPVLWRERPVGCISMMFIRSALTVEKAVESFLRPLQKAAHDIEAALPPR